MATSEQKPKSPQSRSSSIPSLPDVHRKPSGAQWSFLQTLLAQDQQPQADPGFFHPQNTSGGSPASDDNTAGDGTEVDPSSIDESDKLTPEETVTARADKILTASWSATMAGTPDQARRGERRRHSRESASSVRQHSDSVSKKKFKPRTSHDLKQADVSRRRYSSPAATTNTASAKLLEARLKQDNDSASRKSAASNDSARHAPTSEKIASNTTEDAGESQRPGVDKQATTHTPSAADVINTDTETTLTADSRQGPQQVTESGLVTSLTSMSPAQDKQPSQEVAPQVATPSDPINQWTTCRALDDSGDDDLDDNEDNDDGLGQSRTSEAWPHKSHDGADGFYSRANSSNGPRRKRPLLLPPIMLPPVYTMKPTPLKLRDDLYFATAGPRARMSLNEDEWEKLRDCRYLRIRSMRRPIKV